MIRKTLTQRQINGFLYAAETGQIVQIKALIDIAKKSGNKKNVKKLLNAKDLCGRSALHLAADNDYASLEEFLIDAGADLENVDDLDHDTALHLAAKKGNLKSAIILCNRGADLEHRNDLGETPFETALHYHHPEIAKILKKA